MTDLRHIQYMYLALEEAKKAFVNDEVPVGAIIVHNDEVIGSGFNQRENLQNPVAHAEILAITQAAEHTKSWRLNEAIMYVTMEPCAMCAGALVLARIKTVVFSIKDPKGGACGSVFNIAHEEKLNHRLEIISGVLEEESRNLVQSFFREKRELKKKNKQNTTASP